MATVLIKYPDGSQHEQEVEAELTLGRADSNDLVLEEGGVSRRHARIFIEGADVLVEDIGSSNGTFVDGERITGPTPLAPRTIVLIGEYEVSLKPAGAGKPRPAGARPRKAIGQAGSGATARPKPGPCHARPSPRRCWPSRTVSGRCAWLFRPRAGPSPGQAPLCAG